MSNPFELKPKNWPGVNLAITDFRRKPLRVKIMSKIYKKGLKSYINLETFVEPGEVIVAGNLGLRYKVQDEPWQIAPDGSYKLRIKRLDGNNITQTDIDAIIVNKTARVVGRQSFQQQLDQVIKAVEA